MISEEPDISSFVNKKNIMRVGTKDERGMIISKEYGFTVEEENGKILAFDLVNHPDLGTTVLFGEQVFVLKFWDEEDLRKGLDIISKAVAMELGRREDAFNQTPE